MEKKRRIVRFEFTAECEAATDADALNWAINSLYKGGLAEARQLGIKVVAALPANLAALPSPLPDNQYQPPTEKTSPSAA